MTEADLKNTLAAATEEALESMFFAGGLGEPAPDAPPEPELAARVSFAGDCAGWLALRVTARAARQIASDFLGEDESELAEKQAGEVVCELANIVCGSLLSRLDGAGCFRLEAPAAVEPGEIDAAGAQAAYAVQVTGGALAAIVRVEGRKCLSTAKSAS